MDRSSDCIEATRKVQSDVKVRDGMVVFSITTSGNSNYLSEDHSNIAV